LRVSQLRLDRLALRLCLRQQILSILQLGNRGIPLGLHLD
jgi:hypothetical protein